jgi:transposase
MRQHNAAMRGEHTEQSEMFSYITLERRIPEKHPLRKIRELVDDVLKGMNGRFDKIYSHTGRPSIPPERLLKALLLQVLHGIRSERLLLEQIDYNLLYRWFLGMSPDDRVWEETVFSKNRERLLDGEIAELFFKKVLNLARDKGLLSKEHFTVDGTLVESWASLKSVERRDGEDRNDDDGDSGNPSVNFRGEKRSNETHVSKTDPEAKIYTKSHGVAAKLNYMGHVLMENRNGLAVGAKITTAGYYAEPDAALAMAKGLRGEHRKTLGADKHYDQEYFCEGLRDQNITPHVAQNIHSRRPHSAIDERTTRHEGYEVSQRKRKRVEEIFGWLKQWGILRRPHFRGMKRLGFLFKFAVGVYNLLRISNLTLQTA